MYNISFTYKDKNIKIETSSRRETLKKSFDWLFNNGSKFSNLKVYTKSELDELIPKSGYVFSNFHNLSNSGNYLLFNSGNRQILNILKRLLIEIGVNSKSIETEGFQISDTDKIKPFKSFISEDDIDEEDSDNDIDKIKVFVKNPFNQAILILGESGAGKSYTIENILESSNHNYQFIIPTAATTGLLAQYSPSKSAYVPSRLGKMLIEASNNPSELYTAVFDECHKSNVIEMINDELLQAISLKRNRYRFISLDDDTAEVFEDSNLEVKRGNIKIPDNFGFIFISSNPRVIGGNPDFFNRVDLIELTKKDREINNVEGLLSKKVEKSSDKKELIDKLRSK